MNNSAIGQTVVIVGHPREELVEKRLKRASFAPEKIILIDALAQPEVLPAALSEAEHIPAVISQTAGEVELLRYAFGNMASQTPPTAALTALFPGMSIKSRSTVPTLSASEFTSILKKNAGRITLWLDQADEEMTVLKAALDGELSAMVEAIELTCGVEVFFAGSSAKATLENFLTGQGFELTHTDTSDPDWPALRFEQDLKQKALTAAHIDITELSAKLATAERELTENRKQLAQERAAVSTLQAHITDLENRTKTADISRLAAEEASAKSLETIQSLQGELERLETEAEATRQAHEEALQKATDTAAGLNTEVETVTAALAKRDKQIADLSKRVRASEAGKAEEAQRAEANYQITRHDLSLALASLSQQRADNDALQKKHEALFGEKKQLEALLAELTPRLREAAQQLQLLTVEGVDEA